jgi:perosamine synthetase
MNEAIPQYQPIFSPEDQRSVSEYMGSGGWCAEFQQSERFADALAQIAGVKHAVLMNSGTSALATALMALGIGRGDEVLVPNLTMAGTVSAVILSGATPVLVDIEPVALTMCEKGVLEKISARTKAVIHVSLNGRAGTLEKIRAICQARDIPLVEDAAQSMGSCFGSSPLGSIGTIGVYSFSSPKIITTGQGGVALTNSDSLAQKLRRLKNFGREFGGADEYDHVGFNFKFNDLQAALGLSQLKTFSQKVSLKKKIYSTYQENLADLANVEFIATNLKEATPWFVDIYTKDRDALSEYLKANRIGSRKIYPALNGERAFLTDGYFPVSQQYSRKGLWLPSSLDVLEKVPQICRVIRKFYAAT